MIVMIGATILHIARGELTSAMTTAILLVGHICRLYALEGEADSAANRCVTFQRFAHGARSQRRSQVTRFVLPWK